MEQRSPEWFAVRLGKLTGSVAGDMLATIQKGEAAARRDLRTQLVVERLTGKSQENGYVNAEMQRGIDMEPAALGAYELLTGLITTTCGFVAHDSLPAGCSPDGIVDDFGGLVSVKCPKSATHLSYIRAGHFPRQYEPQMLHELWITGAQFYDFISFDDRFVEELQVFHVRVRRESVQGAIDAYVEKATAFLREVDAELDSVVGLMNSRRAAVTA